MPTYEIQSSFNSGELSPNLYARVDLAKFESGAALIRNFTVNYQGGVSLRPGTKYITSAKLASQPPRLIPFVVSTDASYVLEFGNLYIRYISGGEVLESAPNIPYETATPYAYADLALLKFTQSADVLTLVHPSYPPANLTRTSDTTFAYDVITVGPTMSSPVLTNVEATAGGTYAYGYVVTAVSIDGSEESAPSAPGSDGSNILDETSNVIMQLEWSVASQPYSLYNIFKWGPIQRDLSPASVWGFIGQSRTNQFQDNNIAPDFSKPPPQFGDPFSGGQIQSITLTSGGSGYNWGSGWPNIPYLPLVITGDGTGAAGYAIISNSSGKVTGGWLTSPGKNYTTATITADGYGGTGATFSATFSDPRPLYPACVAYIQQRRVFGGSDVLPETLVMSTIGRYDNFDTTPVPLATDAIVLSLASQEVNSIKALVPSSGGLLAFTTGGSFLINGGSPSARISPDTVTAQPQAYTGANDVAPLRVEFDVLYIQAKGNRVRNLSFNWQRQSYAGSDISALASHLFDNRRITEWCWAQEPWKLAWAVRDDGVMLSLTYVPDQEVFAWARHDTEGTFTSVCSVPEASGDAVYCVVQRAAGGGTASYIERFDDRPGESIDDAWFVDSGVALASPSDTVTGLNHLEGLTVTALADGLVVSDLTVSGGSVTLPFSATTAVVGLPFIGQLRTLYLTTEGMVSGTIQGKRKFIPSVTIRAEDTRGISAGHEFDRLTPVQDFIPRGTSTAPISTDAYHLMGPGWDKKGEVCIEQPYPLPANILGVIVGVTVGDTGR